MRIDFEPPLRSGTLIRRYKRFLADVELLDTGETVIAHCVNTGSMSGCSAPGSRVWLEPAPPNTKRKLKWTWVIGESSPGVPVGVHTGYPNRLAELAVAAGTPSALSGYGHIRREVKMGQNSRVDLYCTEHPTAPPCWVEVKNVTLVEDGRALFPDSVTKRGVKHLHELTDRVSEGDRAAMLYVVQRGDAHVVGPAAHIDPDYTNSMRLAQAAGVEMYAIEVEAKPDGLSVVGELPVDVGSAG